MKVRLAYVLIALLVQFFSASAMAGVSQTPLFLGGTADPRVLFVMSRDHQLSIKAYTDYTNIGGDDGLDISYDDSIGYAGYFDSGKCYLYDSTGARFNPSTAVVDGTHECNASSNPLYWSGNFLNWASMTRMDLLRKTVYGGYRSTDNYDSSTPSSSQTILERSFLPNDVHAFAKVYAPGSAAQVQKFTGFSEPAISFCNLSNGTSSPPVIRIAKGNQSESINGWPLWAATEKPQCEWQGSGGSGPEPGTNHKLGEYTVRVAVCVDGLLEENCKTYPNGSSKPTGLLQSYGESTNEQPIRFGLLTGSYQKNKSGGVIRRNVDRISGSNASTDEINESTGVFLNQGTTDAGIINTLNRIRISKYDFGSKKYSGCSGAGITSFNDGECADWGNPLSEMYLEALNYLSGQSSPTAAFNANDGGYIASLPQVTWIDPIPASDYCASTSIVTLSTGLNSFDTDQLSNNLGIDAAALTKDVGEIEELGTSYLLGAGSDVDDKRCSSKNLDDLSDAKGVCPEVPSLEGGYHIAGLAYHANTNDMRTATDYPGAQSFTNYTVALAESLPNFKANDMQLLPFCEANSSGSAFTNNSESGWRACSLTDVLVESSSANEGKFIVTWEDSTFGSDYDQDAVVRLQYCLGPSCPNTDIADDSGVSSGELRTKVDVIAAAAGHAMRVGYTITGTDDDGVYAAAGRNGGCNFSSGAPSCTVAQTDRHSKGASTTGLLENPLWYTAKYGGFKEIDGIAGLSSVEEWDADGDGVPDNYYRVSNPGELGAALASVFESVKAVDSSAAAVATNSTRLDGSTRAYQAQFNNGDWSGHLYSYPLNSD